MKPLIKPFNRTYFGPAAYETDLRAQLVTCLEHCNVMDANFLNGRKRLEFATFERNLKWSKHDTKIGASPKKEP